MSILLKAMLLFGRGLGCHIMIISEDTYTKICIVLLMSWMLSTLNPPEHPTSLTLVLEPPISFTTWSQGKSLLAFLQNNRYYRTCQMFTNFKSKYL